MKNTKRTFKRIITALLLAALLIGCFGISVCAEGDGAEAEKNVFDEGYKLIMAHSSEILSALAFIGSLVIAAAYKRGMLPTLKKGIGTIGTALTEVKSVSELTKEELDRLTEDVRVRIEGLEGIIEKLSAAMEKSESALKNLDTGVTEREKLSAVINEQVSLLYDVFMFSSIPEYQKDAVGHRVEKMKKIIAEEGCLKNEAEREC